MNKRKINKNNRTSNQKNNSSMLFNNLNNNIMNLSNKFMPTIDFFKKIIKILLDFSKSDIVELWLQQGIKNDIFKVVKILNKSFTFNIISLKSDKKQTEKNNYLIQYNLIKLLQEILKKPPPPAVSLKNNDILCTGNIKRTLKEYFAGIHSGAKDYFNSNIFKKYNSIIFIPLHVGDRRIGFILLISGKENFFKASDVQYYKELSCDLGLIISNQQAQTALQERVKELTCLYGIANAAEDYEASLDDIMKKTVMLLKSAWQYPEITQARIILDGKTYSTSNYKNEAGRQTADIIINDIKRGAVEVIYTKKKILLDEGPFLLEERNLINTIAKEISLIAERKYSEIDKKNLEEQLRHADRLATIGQLASGVAHELNEPLCNILGFVQLIQKDHKLTEKTTADLKKILNASLHAREIVRKLLIFARQMPTNKTRNNLNKLIKEGLYFLMSRCEKENIELNLSLDENIPEMIIDPSQLTQILVNLVVNSIQAMPSGGRLNIKTFFHNNLFSLVIEDNGIGMDENTLKQIFIPFFTTKDVGQGTGLGLPVVHGIVTSYGGNIKIDSKVGKGTKFEIQLPIS